MIRFKSSKRFLLAAAISLVFVLFAARWAAREFPISNYYAWRSGIWLDDRYLLVSQRSKSNGRWAASTKAKRYLVDCEKISWTDLNHEFGIDDFSPDDAFVTLDDCFFLPRGHMWFHSGIMHGIKLDPRTMDWEELRPKGSSYTVVGNHYLLSTEEGRLRCLNLIDKSTTESLELHRNEQIRPIPGEPSFLVEYQYNSTKPGTIGWGMMGDSNEDFGSEIQTQVESTEGPTANEESSPPTLEDLEIEAAAMRQGVPPSKIVLRILYTIDDNQLREVNRWIAGASSHSPEFATSFIIEANCLLTEVEIRSQKTGELLRSLAAPIESQDSDYIRFTVSSGTLLFRDSTYNIVSSLDLKNGDPLPLGPQTTYLLGQTENYCVYQLRDTWATQVKRMPSGEIVIDDLNPWAWCSLNFTSDKRSLKFLTESDSVVFLDLESGRTRILKPRALQIWLCYLAWAALAGWTLIWIGGCHQLQLPMLLQSIVTGTVILLVGYWRLTLADTETFRERPAFIAMMGLFVWASYRAVVWVNARPIPLFAKILAVQVLVYVWYYYVYWPKVFHYRSDRFVFEAITIVVVAITWILFKPLASTLFRMVTDHKQEFFRFTITNVVCLTAICAIFVHQFKLIDWQPILQTGWRGFLSDSLLIWTASVILAVVAGWLAARVGKFPRTSIFLCLAVVAILASWNPVAELTFPLYGESHEWWLSLGYFVQKPVIFASSIILAGANFRSYNVVDRSADPTLDRRTYTLVNGRVQITQHQDLPFVNHD